MTSLRTAPWTLALCLCGLAVSAPAAAEPFVLQPAEASYRVLVTGIPTGIEANIRLTADPQRDQGFRLSFQVDHALIQHQEDSGFLWRDDCSAVSDSYRFTSSGFGIRRGGEVAFDWHNARAVGNGVPYPIPVGAVDALALTQLARCMLGQGKDQLSFQVAEPAGLEEFRYRVIGRERLRTPAGEFTTIKVERLYPERGRRTFLWAAEELGWFLIRMDHIENPLVRGRMELTRFASSATTTPDALAGP